MRSMQLLERERGLREEAAKSYDQFKSDRTGDAGVASAMSGRALKSAESADAAALSAQQAFSRRYGMASRSSGSAGGPATSSYAVPAAPAPAQPAQITQPSQFVAGKTFFQNEKQWMDSAIQKHPDAPRVRLQFGSTEYFDFVNKNPKALAWLALGQNVQFFLNGTIYEIYE